MAKATKNNLHDKGSQNNFAHFFQSLKIHLKNAKTEKS